MLSTLGRIGSLMLIYMQIDAGNLRAAVYTAIGIFAYGFLVHKESYELGYENATKELVKVKTNGV